MASIAFHTLGCKVNQYDTQAMSELFEAAGYETVPFTSPADIYLINTCTVTGTGDKKSLQLARRIRREHPDSRLILCGCMAQRQSSALLETGADLVLGTQRRGEVVSLIQQAIREKRQICAVEPLGEQTPFERLRVTAQSDHTRATLKIQEGCNGRCAYCIIPSVRGPIRSRPLEEIREEALHLVKAGYRELVLTGIHISSYGKEAGFPSPAQESAGKRLSLLDVLGALQMLEGLMRIRLGSLEPTIATPAFASALGEMDKVCPQFHLALQSGSDGVLRRMRRRYTAAQYLEAVENLRAVFPRAAFTTDILTGFPGETEEEFQETRRMMERVGFARVHVFPYSSRPDTPAAGMPGQLSAAEKERRARNLIALGKQISRRYLETWLGQTALLLPEEQVEGCWEGYTPEYLRVRLPHGAICCPNEPLPVRLTGLLPELPCAMTGEPV